MALEAATYGIRCDCSGCLCGSAEGASAPSMPPLPPAPPISPKPPLVAMEIATYAELRQQLAAATPGSSLAFTLAPGEVLEIEASLVIAGISVSISSLSIGSTIRRAAWANSSRIFEVRDAGHLLLSRVNIANGTSNGEDGGVGGGILVMGVNSILTAEFLVVSDCQTLGNRLRTQGLEVLPGESAEFGGGIAAGPGAELRLHGVRVERCRSSFGAGIGLLGSSAVLTDCHIIGGDSYPTEADFLTDAAESLGFVSGILATSSSVVSWRGGGIANCTNGVATSASTFHMMDAAISGCRAGVYAAVLILEGYASEQKWSIGNLTNVSVSDWRAPSTPSRTKTS